MTAVAAPRAPHNESLKVAGPWAWVAVVLVVAVLAAIAGVIAVFTHHPPSPTACVAPDGCSGPVNVPPVSASRPWHSALGFTLDLQNPCDDIWSKTVEDSGSIGWIAGHTWPVTFGGSATGGRSAEQIVNDLQRAAYPNATAAFHIPGAELGYVNGAGQVYDLVMTSASSRSLRARLLIMVAVRGSVAVWVKAVDRYTTDTDDHFDHPNPVGMQLADCFDGIANSVEWR